MPNVECRIPHGSHRQGLFLFTRSTILQSKIRRGFAEGVMGRLTRLSAVVLVQALSLCGASLAQAQTFTLIIHGGGARVSGTDIVHSHSTVSNTFNNATVVRVTLQ
jgi:hypothetical protein